MDVMISMRTGCMLEGFEPSEILTIPTNKLLDLSTSLPINEM